MSGRLATPAASDPGASHRRKPAVGDPTVPDVKDIGPSTSAPTKPDPTAATVHLDPAGPAPLTGRVPYGFDRRLRQQASRV